LTVPTPTKPQTLLIAVQTHLLESAQWTTLDSLAELSELARTAELEVVSQIIQNRDHPHPKFYVGEGKVEEIKTYITAYNITVIIADDELTPAQNKALEEELKVKVIDRTGLILDIFARNARTFESKLQVELAQLEYVLPRLTRMWTHLSRLGGGIGSRGPGETQLEVDKRQIRHKITHIKEKLEKIKSHRTTLRQKRENTPTSTIAIIGYTNAGKSTLLNRLTQAHALAENKLFATLDPTTKPLKLPNNETVLLTDTVGFIQKLPHQLVSSFRATLEEIKEAQFLLHVIDGSSPKAKVYIETALEILKEIKADDIPQLFVFNKIDLSQHHWAEIAQQYTPYVAISAKENIGIEDLINTLMSLRKNLLETTEFTLNYTQMDIVDLIHKNSSIIEEKFEPDHIYIKARINKILSQKIQSEKNFGTPKG
jgi:GTPase